MPGLGDLRSGDIQRSVVADRSVLYRPSTKAKPDLATLLVAYPHQTDEIIVISMTSRLNADGWHRGRQRPVCQCIQYRSA